MDHDYALPARSTVGDSSKRRR